MLVDRSDIGRAIAHLEKISGARASGQLYQQYALGLSPTILSYGKGRTDLNSATPLERYIVGALGYVRVHAHFYDIFNACRGSSLLCPLSNAIQVLKTKKIKGHKERVERLFAASNCDDFDSILFELVVASKYAENPLIKGLEFIEETADNKTPDLTYSLGGGKRVYCECKKPNRMTDHAFSMKAQAEQCLSPLLAKFREMFKSVVADVVFQVRPDEIASDELLRSCRVAIDTRRPVQNDAFLITVRELPRWESDSFQLYPAPNFDALRYGYTVRGEWAGILRDLEGRFSNHMIGPRRVDHGRSSWLSDIDWDCAIKWKIGPSQLFEKYKRFAFKNIYEGLTQAGALGEHGIVHLWLESEYFQGDKTETFLNFLQDLDKRPRPYDWLIINETLFDTSPEGRFDVVEHARFRKGSGNLDAEPQVLNVFSDGVASTSDFHRAPELPGIDDVLG